MWNLFELKRPHLNACKKHTHYQVFLNCTIIPVSLCLGSCAGIGYLLCYLLRAHSTLVPEENFTISGCSRDGAIAIKPCEINGTLVRFQGMYTLEIAFFANMANKMEYGAIKYTKLRSSYAVQLYGEHLVENRSRSEQRQTCELKAILESDPL